MKEKKRLSSCREVEDVIVGVLSDEVEAPYLWKGGTEKMNYRGEKKAFCL
jgi:hypothetical protein